MILMGSHVYQLIKLELKNALNTSLGITVLPFICRNLSHCLKISIQQISDYCLLIVL
jgi:hypothetical protein